MPIFQRDPMIQVSAISPNIGAPMFTPKKLVVLDVHPSELMENHSLKWF